MIQDRGGPVVESSSGAVSPGSGGFLGQIRNFSNDIRAELSKVTWPTYREAVRVSLLVVLLIAVSVVVLAGTDALVVSLILWCKGL